MIIIICIFWIQGLIMQVRKRNGAGLTTNPTNYFNKTWSQYKTGFGNIDSDYWIGLENLYNLTNTYEWSLIVRLELHKNQSKPIVMYELRHILSITNYKYPVGYRSGLGW